MRRLWICKSEKKDKPSEGEYRGGLLSGVRIKDHGYGGQVQHRDKVLPYC